MTLREKRVLFTKLLAKLIEHINETDNHECALDQVKRDQRTADLNAATGAGIKNSLHLLGLAADVNLYSAGVYLDSSEAHKQFGEWWEQQHPLCRWGGRFSRPDGNHYSLEHEGVK